MGENPLKSNPLVSMSGVAIALCITFLLIPSDSVAAQQLQQTESRIATLGDVPGWLRSYPGATPNITSSSKTDNSVYLSFEFSTGDAINKVADFYKQNRLMG